MSIRVMSKVWDEAPYNLGTLLVLLALADWADDEGLCWPKNAQLQKKTRLSERQVRNAMALLEAEKVITVVEESRGAGLPRKYQIGGQYLPPLKSTGGQILPKRGAISDSAIRKNRHEPSVNLKPPNPPFSKGGLSSRDRNNIAKELDRIASASIGMYVPDQEERTEQIIQCVAARLILPLEAVKEAVYQSYGLQENTQ
jgi:Helix-turn-helix domain